MSLTTSVPAIMPIPPTRLIELEFDKTWDLTQAGMRLRDAVKRELTSGGADALPRIIYLLEQIIAENGERSREISRSRTGRSPSPPGSRKRLPAGSWTFRRTRIYRYSR